MNILEEFKVEIPRFCGRCKKYEHFNYGECECSYEISDLVKVGDVEEFIRSKFNQLLDEIPVEEKLMQDVSVNSRTKRDIHADNLRNIGYNQHYKIVKEFIKTKKL